jgi:hypothetical protein
LFFNPLCTAASRSKRERVSVEIFDLNSRT